MIDEEPLIWMCCLQIVIYSFFIHLPILPFFRPPIPPFSPLKLKNFFFAGWNSWWGSSGTKWICRQVCVVFTLYYSAVKFVLCSLCTTCWLMSAVQVVIGVRHFQVDAFSMCQKDERSVIKMRHLLSCLSPFWMSKKNLLLSQWVVLVW